MNRMEHETRRQILAKLEQELYGTAAPFCRQFEMLDPAAYQSILGQKRPSLV